MKISHNGLVEVEKSEGFSSKPYWDKYGKKWTIGFGETDGIGPNTKPITRAQAEARLISRFAKDYAWALEPFPYLNQNQYDALGSFIWNCGVGAVKSTGPNSTTVGRAIKARNWHAVAAAMKQWNKANGVFMQGLYDRRVREAKLLLTPVKAPARLEKSEEDHIEILQTERKIARRHGAWGKVDKSHKANAHRAKSWLEARVKAIPGSKPSSRPARRAEMTKALKDTFNGV